MASASRESPTAAISSETRAALTPVPPELRRAILDAPRTPESLRRAEELVPALREIEMANPPPAPPPGSLRVAAWNLQQCHFPEAAAAILAGAEAGLVLASEVDIGLRRTGQRHNAGLLAERLGDLAGVPHGYAAGVEFFELLATGGATGSDGGGGENRLGFHANAWLTRLAARRPALIRLPSETDWFVNPRRNQRRLGGRMALAGTFRLAGGEFVAVSVHLESDAGPEGRGRQMAALLSAVDGYADGRPVIIGGDFNTGARHPEFDFRGETLFREAEARGYRWDEFNTGTPTSRKSLVVNAVQQDRARYDWFFARGLSGSAPAVIPAVGPDGAPISDHDAIAVTIHLPGGQA